MTKKKKKKREWEHNSVALTSEKGKNSPRAQMTIFYWVFDEV